MASDKFVDIDLVKYFGEGYAQSVPEYLMRELALLINDSVYLEKHITLNFHGILNVDSNALSSMLRDLSPSAVIYLYEKAQVANSNWTLKSKVENAVLLEKTIRRLYTY